MAMVAVERGAIIVDKPIKNRFIARKSEKEIFKERTARLMREQGASEELIAEELTDIAVENSILNHFTPENLAWALLQ